MSRTRCWRHSKPSKRWPPKRLQQASPLPKLPWKKLLPNQLLKRLLKANLPLKRQPRADQPVTRSDFEFNDTDGLYARQVILPEIGQQGQARLQKSRVLVVGAGGLGSPILMNLAGAGVGHLTLIDHDTVSMSNLNRQFLYTVADIGQPKATIARQRLLAYHPDVEVTALDQTFTDELARQVIPGQDLVVAAVDNRAARRLINHACYRLEKPWIDGGVRGFSGSVAVYRPGKTACFDCRFDLAEENLDCALETGMAANLTATPKRSAATIGALGATASVIGSLEADLALCLLLGLGDPLQGEILYYHGRTLDFQRVAVAARPDCLICGSNPNE
ncbi:MAG: HesA/MoeB/ThiF family protein [Clostridia bacterium]|nr:HesA/MoeB/ThiF family protein [Clostridia bacterium]